MTIKFDLTNTTRKNIATALAEQLGSTVSYCGAPSFAYNAGPATVSKDGTVTFTEDTDKAAIRKALDALADADFEYERPAELDDPEPQADATDMTISYPIEILTEDGLRNLQALIASKKTLICKALGIDDLPVRVTETQVDFPWFVNQSPEATHACATFVCKLCEMAKNQQRVTAKEKPTDNDKYAFRCFLLRLGFIGDEYKADRKVLLQNLSGSTAFRNGKKNYAPGLDPIPTPENTVEFDVAEAKRRLQDPQVQAEIRAILNED